MLLLLSSYFRKLEDNLFSGGFKSQRTYIFSLNFWKKKKKKEEEKVSCCGTLS